LRVRRSPPPNRASSDRARRSRSDSSPRPSSRSSAKRRRQQGKGRTSSAPILAHQQTLLIHLLTRCPIAPFQLKIVGFRAQLIAILISVLRDQDVIACGRVTPQTMKDTYRSEHDEWNFLLPERTSQIDIAVQTIFRTPTKVSDYCVGAH